MARPKATSHDTCSPDPGLPLRRQGPGGLLSLAAPPHCPRLVCLQTCPPVGPGRRPDGPEQTGLLFSALLSLAFTAICGF